MTWYKWRCLYLKFQTKIWMPKLFDDKVDPVEYKNDSKI